MDFVDQLSLALEQVSTQGGEMDAKMIPHRSGVERTTSAGKQTLWIVFAIMTISTVLFAGMTIRQQAKNRLFYHITLFITVFASIAYYSMASGGGATYIIAPGHHAVREVLWARYADWAVTTPLLLLDLTLLAGLPGVDIALIIIADIGMVLTGLFGALDNGVKTKWFYFAVSSCFFLYVVYSLVFTSRKTSYLRSERVGKLYVAISWYTIFLWTLYPIAWALSEGTNYLSADQEVLFYGILDVLAKPVFGAWLLIAHSSIAESNVVLPESWVEPRGAAGGYGALGSSD